MRFAQLALPLSLDRETQIAIASARLFRCERYACALSRSECIGRQMPSAEQRRARRKREAEAFGYCESGRCKQGLALLIEAGLVRWMRCPTCEGCGKVPCEAETGGAERRAA